MKLTQKEKELYHELSDLILNDTTGRYIYEIEIEKHIKHDFLFRIYSVRSRVLIYSYIYLSCFGSRTLKKGLSETIEEVKKIQNKQ